MTKKRKVQSRKARLALLDEVASTISDEGLGSLTEFAEFLHTRYPAIDKAPQLVVEIPRPEEESVIAAIKRLTKTYPMLDKKVLFEQTSVAMSAHVMQDVSPEESIDRLEAVFLREYQSLSQK